MGRQKTHPWVAKNLGVTALPVGPRGRTTFIGGSNLAVSTHCSYPEEAWALVRFLSTRESQRRHAQGISALPARMDSLEDIFSGHEENRSVFIGSFGFARTLGSPIAKGSVERALWYFGERMIRLILNSGYNPHSLQHEVELTDREINTIISFYSRFGGKKAS